MSSSKSRDNRPSGPELLGKPSTVAEGHRILSQLEHGVAPPLMAVPPGQRSAWWRPAGAALFVVLATVALLAMLSTHTGQGIQHDTQQDTEQNSRPALPAPVHATTQATVQVAASPPSLPPAPATIVNLATPATLPLTLAGVKTIERKAVLPQRKAATTRPVPAGNSDNDVTLLTAMVAHSHRQDGAQDRAHAEPARDVVVRREEEETISLLQRCKQLGLIEGMLCRSRICSGRWDSDPACH